MIVLLTDYSYQGPYLGQLKARILEYAPSASIVDLMHDLPAFNITAAANLIPAITSEFPVDTIFICVVDPGVGSDRKPILLKTTDYYFVGPDNGIFDKILANKNCAKWEILWRPEKLSSSFHGRDIFAVIAAKLFNKTLNYNTSLRKLVTNNELVFTEKFQIIYFDNFGNAITSVEKSEISEDKQLKINNFNIQYHQTFSRQQPGCVFWYFNSMNLVEIACNLASAQNELGLSIGQMFDIV